MISRSTSIADSMAAGRKALYSGAAAIAEAHFRRVVDQAARNSEAATLLADALREQGRYVAAGETMLRYWQASPQSSSDFHRCADMLRQCQRSVELLGLAEAALRQGLRDPKIAATAGQSALALGRFADARRYFETAIEQGVDQNEWLMLLGLSMTQTFTVADQDVLTLFKRTLDRRELRGAGRASALLALGKIHDDRGEFSEAARSWRAAKALLARDHPWNPAGWRRLIHDALGIDRPFSASSASTFQPIFVVGLPRSGTTLVAERLSRLGSVRSRGELGWIPFAADRLRNVGPEARSLLPYAGLVERHMRQDDAPARYYLDKNPNNFLNLRLVEALFPHARIIWCRRHLPATALSIWSHYFETSEIGFYNRFEDIQLYAEGERALFKHFGASLSLPILECRYEDFVADSTSMMQRLSAFLDLPNDPPAAKADSQESVMATASAWQVRQPIYHQALERWRSYREWVPELDSIAAIAGSAS